MSKIIDYYLSPVSPYTYMGGPRLAEMADHHGARIVYKPMELAKIFPASGGLPLAKRAPQRQAYRLVELERWRDHLGMELNLKPKFFPAAEWPAAGMMIAAQDQGLDCGVLTNAILGAVWAEERDIADADTLRDIARQNGLDGDALLAAADTDSVKEIYALNTESALAAGVFGAPSYVFNGILYWGQDRLEFLERALAAA